MSDATGAPEGTVTWAALLSETVSILSSAGLDDARGDARRIVAEAAGTSTSSLLVVAGEPATERGVAHLDDMVRRRSTGEPLQYVLGSWGFRMLDLMVDPRVLIPRPETEAVVEVALGELDRVGGHERSTRVLDLGTGSGAIALSIAVERVRAEVWATDASADALDVATANIAGLGRPGARVRTLHGSWFEPLPVEMRNGFDLIVSNPPYVPLDLELPADVADWEPPGALRSGGEGLDDLVHLVRHAGGWLRPGASLVTELSPEQGERLVEVALEHFDAARLEPDLTGRVRALVATGPRS